MNLTRPTFSSKLPLSVAVCFSVLLAIVSSNISSDSEVARPAETAESTGPVEQAPNLATVPQDSSTGFVSVLNGRVTVRLQGMQLGDAMTSFTEQTGILVRVATAVAGEALYDEFSDLSLEAALHRLLQHKSYALVFSTESGRREISEVLIVASEPGAAPEVSEEPMESSVVEGLLRNVMVPDAIRDALLDTTKQAQGAAPALVDPKLFEKLLAPNDNPVVSEDLSALIEELKSATAGQQAYLRHKMVEQVLKHLPQGSSASEASAPPTDSLPSNNRSADKLEAK